MSEDASSPDGSGHAGRLAEETLPKDDLVGDPVVHDRQHEETFAVRLELDPSVSGEAALGYVATVAAKHMGEGSRRLLGEARGRVDTAGETVVEVDSTGTGPGIYLVEAAVALLDPESGTARGLASLHEGVVLHVS